MPDLFEIITRQTVLLCARKGSNKYKKKDEPRNTFLKPKVYKEGEYMCVFPNPVNPTTS